MKENTKVFVSYAKEDRPAAQRLSKDLKRSGLDPWIDVERLLPGQQWEVEIERAIEASRFFIAMLSSKSVSKVGIVQKELKKALSVWEKYSAKDVFIIPIRIDDCSPSSPELLRIQWADMFPAWEDGLKKIVDVIKAYGFSGKHDSELVRTLPEMIEFFESSELGRDLALIIKLFTVHKVLSRRQISLASDTRGSLTRAYLEMLKYRGMLYRMDDEHRTLYSLTENGKVVLDALKRI
jgi:predicted transcriptional regulator